MGQIDEAGPGAGLESRPIPDHVEQCRHELVNKFGRVQLIGMNFNLSPWQAVMVIAVILVLLFGWFAFLVAEVIPHFYELGE